MIGWLVDTNVIASLIAPNGAPSVKAWGRIVDERRLFIRGSGHESALYAPLARTNGELKRPELNSHFAGV